MVLRTDYEPRFRLSVLADAVARAMGRTTGRLSEVKYENDRLEEVLTLLIKLGADDPFKKNPLS